MKKSFHISDILTITTGRLVSTRGVDGVYDILNFMTEDDIFTHQIPRAASACKPCLLNQYPNLANVPLDVFKDINDQPDFDVEKIISLWLQPLIETYGEYLDVEMLTEWKRLHPVEEALQMLNNRY